MEWVGHKYAVDASSVLPDLVIFDHAVTDSYLLCALKTEDDTFTEFLVCKGVACFVHSCSACFLELVTSRISESKPLVKPEPFVEENVPY